MEHLLLEDLILQVVTEGTNCIPIEREQLVLIWLYAYKDFLIPFKVVYAASLQLLIHSRIHTIVALKLWWSNNVFIEEETQSASTSLPTNSPQLLSLLPTPVKPPLAFCTTCNSKMGSQLCFFSQAQSTMQHMLQTSCKALLHASFSSTIPYTTNLTHCNLHMIILDLIFGYL